MVGTEQDCRADLGFREAVSARRGVIRDLVMQRITGVITASLPETDCTRSVHRYAAETDHRAAFEMSARIEYDPRSGCVLLPASCFVIQVTFCRVSHLG